MVICGSCELQDYETQIIENCKFFVIFRFLHLYMDVITAQFFPCILLKYVMHACCL